MLIQKDKILLYISSIVIILLVAFSYQHYISPIFNNQISNFGRYGYELGNFNLLNFYFILIINIFIVYTLPTEIENPSDLIIIIYYFFSTVPYFSLYSLSLIESQKYFYIDFLSILIFYGILYFTLIREEKKYKLSISHNSNSFLLFILIVSFIIGVYLISKYVLSSQITSFLDVYKQRAIFNASGFFNGYLVSFTSFGIITYLVYEYEKKRKNILLLTILILNFIIFLSTGSKLIFMATFLILIFSFIYKKLTKSYFIGYGLIVMIFISILYILLFDNYQLMSIAVRRTLVLPAQIFYLYFEHFSTNGANFLAKYTHLMFNSEYSISSAHTIGETYFLKNTHANSGIISDAYANFGIIGVVLYTMIFSVILNILNFMNIYLNNKFTPLFVGVAISLTNSSILSVFVYQILPIIIIFNIYLLINSYYWFFYRIRG